MCQDEKGRKKLLTIKSLLHIRDCKQENCHGTADTLSRITRNYKPWDLDSHLEGLRAQGFRSKVWPLYKVLQTGDLVF